MLKEYSLEPRVRRLDQSSPIKTNPKPSAMKHTQNQNHAPGVPLPLKPVIFEFTHSTATTVSVAGTFNDWHPAKSMHAMDNGRWLHEMALAPGFRTDFRESLYRMMASLTGTGVTVLSTVELDESFTEFRFSHYMVSFLADDILRLRYLDLEGVLHRILTVVKMRDSQHSKDICAYAITQQGVVLTDRRLNAYRALITGIPARWSQGEPIEEP
jgi:hypothetical protein